MTSLWRPSLGIVVRVSDSNALIVKRLDQILREVKKLNVWPVGSVSFGDAGQYCVDIVAVPGHMFPLTKKGDPFPSFTLGRTERGEYILTEDTVGGYESGEDDY